jgi:hypothetical protein
MSRVPIAALAGLAGFVLYIMAAVALADQVPDNQILRGLYFLAAGLLWVLPARWLMLWAARKR